MFKNFKNYEVLFLHPCYVIVYVTFYKYLHRWCFWPLGTSQRNAIATTGFFLPCDLWYFLLLYLKLTKSNLYKLLYQLIFVEHAVLFLDLAASSSSGSGGSRWLGGGGG